MGLDSVELVMECEDEFGITISDFEAEQTTTVGELAELVIKLLRRKGELEPIQFCESSRLFYQLRALVRVCRRTRHPISSPIDRQRTARPTNRQGHTRRTLRA